MTPTIVSVPAAGLQAQRESLLNEAFGPLSIVVEYGEEAYLAALAADLFEGNLTGTLHAAVGEDTPSLSDRWSLGSRYTPTGVAVTPAMQHGGPWPATTNDSGTSVGTAAIGRFLRAVAYQGAPPEFLPEPLRDDNPWRVPQHRSPIAGLGHSRSLTIRPAQSLRSLDRQLVEDRLAKNGESDRHWAPT